MGVSSQVRDICLSSQLHSCIPAECHTPEYHIELNLIRELVKLVWYSSYMNLECQTPEHHIVDWMCMLFSDSFKIMLCKIFLVRSQKLKTEIN